MDTEVLCCAAIRLCESSTWSPASGAAQRDRATERTLIAGYPARIWKNAEFAALYAAGAVAYTQLPIGKEWPSLLKHSKGAPLRIPNAIEVTEVARIGLMRGGEPWQLRTVAIEPAMGGWLELREGRLYGAAPYQPD